MNKGILYFILYSIELFPQKKASIPLWNKQHGQNTAAKAAQTSRQPLFICDVIDNDEGSDTSQLMDANLNKNCNNFNEQHRLLTSPKQK